MPIRKNASMEKYIKDFEKSDAPQFKGKSKEKRREMAVAAKLQAMDKKMEEVDSVEEAKGTLCGRCGHVHVKGTPCPRPFKEGAKPDYLDFDKDGNTTEPMKSAVKDSKLKHEVVANVLGKIKEAEVSPAEKTAKDAEVKALQLRRKAIDDELTRIQRAGLTEGLDRDYEGEMAKSQLFSIVKNAKELFDMIDNNTQLEGWVQSKLTKAEDYLSAVASYLEGQSITSTTPVMVAEEAIKDEGGSSLSVGDVVKAGDGGIYQVIYSYSEGKPFLVPFDLKKRKVVNLRNRIYFDSDSSISKRLHKVMSHSATKGGFIK